MALFLCLAAGGFFNYLEVHVMTTATKTPTIALNDGLLHSFVQPLRFSAFTAIGGIQALAQGLVNDLSSQRIGEPAKDLDGQIQTAQQSKCWPICLISTMTTPTAGNCRLDNEEVKNQPNNR